MRTQKKVTSNFEETTSSAIFSKIDSNEQTTPELERTYKPEPITPSTQNTNLVVPSSNLVPTTPANSNSDT